MPIKYTTTENEEYIVSGNVLKFYNGKRVTPKGGGNWKFVGFLPSEDSSWDELQTKPMKNYSIAFIDGDEEFLSFAFSETEKTYYVFDDPLQTLISKPLKSASSVK